MPSSYTPNYNLSQWEASDKVQRVDFNADNAKIDAALGEHGEKLQTRGNGSLYYASYTGTGTYGSSAPSSLTFPGYPALVFIFSEESGYIIAMRSSNRAIRYFNSTSCMLVTWTGNTLFWSDYQSDVHQMNAKGKKYSVVALLDLEK